MKWKLPHYDRVYIGGIRVGNKITYVVDVLYTDYTPHGV